MTSAPRSERIISKSEIAEKELRVRGFMEDEGLDALALTTIPNFAWFTCGGNNCVGIATEVGVATGLVTRDARYIVCDNIEAPRLRDEEIDGQGFEIRSFGWHEGRRDEIIQDIVDGGVLGSDVPMTGAMSIGSALDPVRYSLTSEEIDRYRWLGRSTGECIAQAARLIEPGMTEHQIAGVLDGLIFERGMTPVVTLIAVDERIGSYRHPVPTDKKLERYAMLVTGARRWGLVCSVTRLVCFGEAPPALRCGHYAVTRVDAAMIAATTVGARMGDILQRGIDAYAETGFGDEWKLHHQGGPTGYKGRDFRVTPHTDALVLENQAMAWNPSVTGTKSEDTIIATPSGPEIISAIDDWPMIDVEVEGAVIARPDILVR